MVSLLLPLLLVLAVVLVVRKVSSREGSMPSDGHVVRRTFQYLLLYGLVLVVASGVSGLLGRLLRNDDLLVRDATGLALELSFTVVGGPLLAGVVVWSRRTFRELPTEGASLGWAFYCVAASLTALVVAMTGLTEVLRWVVGLEEYAGGSLAQILVWGGVWAAHWRLESFLAPPEHTRVHHLTGSLVGLVTVAVGLAGLLSGALRALLGLDGGALLASSGDPLRQGLVLLLVGAPVWLVYWVRNESKRERGPLWFTYVLLAGVGGGLVTALVATSTLLHSVLVWLIGNPRASEAVVHFDNAPTAAAAAVVGALVWWHHQTLLTQADAGPRTEVRRSYELLMAALGLSAAATGLVMVMAGLIEVATGTAFAGGTAVNNLLAAATLVAVGGPVWWLHWSRVQAAALAAPEAELDSPSRKIYLFVLFGVGGVATVIALIVGVYFLFQAVVEGTIGTETLRRMRFAIGVLIATAAVSAYHWAVYRSDRGRIAGGDGSRGPRFVLLVGPADPRIAQEVALRTHGRVQAWSTIDGGMRAWSVEEVVEALEKTTADEVMVLADGGALRAIPVRRDGSQ